VKKEKERKRVSAASSPAISACPFANLIDKEARLRIVTGKKKKRKKRGATLAGFPPNISRTSCGYDFFIKGKEKREGRRLFQPFRRVEEKFFPAPSSLHKGRGGVRSDVNADRRFNILLTLHLTWWVEEEKTREGKGGKRTQILRSRLPSSPYQVTSPR